MLLKQRYASVYVGLLVFMFDQMAMAQSAGSVKSSSKFGEVLNNPVFKVSITTGFGILAFWKWIEFFSKFETSSALTNAITPAILTFMAFQWTSVLSWVGIM
jgi:hypothetical protein